MTVGLKVADLHDSIKRNLCLRATTAVRYNYVASVAAGRR
jgi:hypothetical protein